ncbi:hypothetical protein IMSAG049_01395 [Clostridiales bacterium]|nr:hypothetical protein IMSAG049_01395 [Clostridiales bacterium]
MDKPKIAIIGMGFLMSYLKPCYHHVIGKNLQNNIVASTNSASTIEKKSKEMGFPVQCQEYYSMLVDFEPDIILFAPPPSAAKAIAKDILAPYYDSLRQNGNIFPPLYAFPPYPQGNFYLDTIGHDIYVVNILPNMAAKLKEHDISKESYTIFTFSEENKWPDNLFRELENFFSPIGYTVSVPSNKFKTMLGGFTSSHITEEIAISVSDGLTKGGIEIPYSTVAGAMRFALLNKFNRHIPNSLECAPLSDDRVNEAVKNVIMSVYNGMMDYYTKNGMDTQLGMDILIPQIDIFLQSAQLLSLEEISYNNSCHATKGGLLEKALNMYHNEVEVNIVNTFANFAERGTVGHLYQFIHDKSGEICSAVSEHGSRFAG